MHKIKIAKYLFVTGIIFFIVYNSFFGWNLKPINEAERICDDIVKWIYRIGMAFYVLPILDVYDYHIKKFYSKRDGGI